MSEEEDHGFINTPAKKKRREYNFDNLIKAYEDVMSGKLTAMKASIKHGVPRTTLRDRINGKVKPESKHPGPASLLGQDVEKKLWDHIISLNNRGVTPTYPQVLDIANDIAYNKKLRDRSSPLSQRWVRLFVKRWPELKLLIAPGRTPGKKKQAETHAGNTGNHNLLDFNKGSCDDDDDCDDDNNTSDESDDLENGDEETLAAATVLDGDVDEESTERVDEPQQKKQKTNVIEPMSSKNHMDQYFKDLIAVLAMYNMMNKPECIYHLDDKGLVEYLQPQLNIVSSSADLQHPLSEKKKVVSVIGGGNALGHHIPPFFVFQSSVPSEEELANLPAGTGFSSSPTGWPTMKIFREYLQNHFIRYAQGRNIDQPVLVIYNVQKAHFFCHDDLISDINIVMFASPAHTKDNMYPFTGPDCFGPFDILYNCMRFQHMARTNSPKLKPSEVCKIAARAYEAAVTPSNLRQTFEKCGTYPFNPSAVFQTPESKLSVLHPDDGREKQISVILSQSHLTSICGQSSTQETSSSHRSEQGESSADSSPAKKTKKRNKKGKKKKIEKNSDCQTIVSQSISGLGLSGVENIDVDTNLCGMCIASTITI